MGLPVLVRVGVRVGEDTGAVGEDAIISRPFPLPSVASSRGEECLSKRAEKVALPLKIVLPRIESPRPVPDERRENGTESRELRKPAFRSPFVNIADVAIE